MKLKWLMLLAMSIPLMTLGDLPRTTEIHRLRRIGNNIDVVSGIVHNDCMDLLIPALLMFLGICILVVFNRRKKLRPAIEGAGRKIVVKLVKFAIWCVVLVALWRFVRENGYVFSDNTDVIILVSDFVLLFGMGWGFVDVFGRRSSIIMMCSVIGGLWAGLDISGFSHFLLQAMLGKGPSIYVYGPGWHYPDKVPDSDRKAVMAIMTDDLLADLQKAIDEDGYPIKWANYWQGKRAEIWSKEQALLSALKSREDLAARCKGVPIEWLVDRLVFGRWGDARNTFMEWADIHSPNLSTSENSILFKWQFYVCIKELREWRSIFGVSPYSRDDQEDATGSISRWGSQEALRQARIPESIPISSDFKDFVDDSSNGVAFVEYWHNKAKSLGYNPDPEDVALYEKRHIFKTARKIEKRKRRSFSSLNDIPSERKRDWGRKLQHCVNMDDVKGVKRLLEENAKELKDTKISFESIFDGFSGSADEMAIVRMLDEKGFELPFKKVKLGNVLRISVKDSGSLVDVLDYLIGKGVDVNQFDSFGNTLLSNLCEDGDWDNWNDLGVVVRFLFEKGANPNLGRNPPLIRLTTPPICSQPGVDEVMKLLLEHGADPNGCTHPTFRQSPLWCAVTYHADIKVTKLLVQHGATITDKIIKQADKGSAIQKYLLEKSGKTEADIYRQRKAKFDGVSENKADGKCSDVPSFGKDRSCKIHEEMDRYMREVREFHENRKPGERFDHDRLRQIHDEHHRRMRELHNGM